METITRGNTSSQRRSKRKLMSLSYKDSDSTTCDCTRPRAPFNSTSFLIRLHNRREEAASLTSLNLNQYGSMVKIMTSPQSYTTASYSSSAENYRYQLCFNHSRAAQHPTLANSSKHSNLPIQPHSSRNAEPLQEKSSMSDILPSSTARH